MVRKYILPPLIAAIYWVWSHTWRLKVIEDPAMREALTRGPVAFAHWHGDEMVVLRLGRRYHCAAMTSTSKDGELMTRVLRFFGFGISRGSSTRGGAQALLGMVRLSKLGFNATVAVDGPKGPRHKVKAGVWHVARLTGAPVIPTGVARKRALVFERSWNKTYLPWPFTRVIVSFGAPIGFPADFDDTKMAGLEALLEERLHLQRGVAQAQLLGGKK
jgi:lysophospholipid acyltransferase (LPLAT)-like uncharacterized protein